MKLYAKFQYQKLYRISISLEHSLMMKELNFSGVVEAQKDFPDFQRTIADIIAEGDKVWVYVKYSGTSIAGRKIESEVVTIFRIVNRKIVEGRSIPQLVTREKKLKVT